MKSEDGENTQRSNLSTMADAGTSNQRGSQEASPGPPGPRLRARSTHRPAQASYDDLDHFSTQRGNLSTAPVPPSPLLRERLAQNAVQAMGDHFGAGAARSTALVALDTAEAERADAMLIGCRGLQQRQQQDQQESQQEQLHLDSGGAELAQGLIRGCGGQQTSNSLNGLDQNNSRLAALLGEQEAAASRTLLLASIGNMFPIEPPTHHALLGNSPPLPLRGPTLPPTIPA